VSAPITTLGTLTRIVTGSEPLKAQRRGQQLQVRTPV
jgi:hypothetical protein